MATKKLPTLSISERLAMGGALGMDEVAAWAGIGRGKLYKEIAAGRIKITKIGSRSVVLAEEAKRWLSSLSEVA